MKEYQIIEPCTVTCYYYVEAEDMKDALRQWASGILTSDKQSNIETDFKEKGIEVVETAEDNVPTPMTAFSPSIVSRIIAEEEGWVRHE